MNRLLLLSVILITGFSFGQEPIIEWEKSLGGSDFDFAQSIQLTSDGGYIIAGRSDSNDGDVTGNHGGYDYWIVKLDSSGNITWQKSLGGSNQDIGTSIQQTTDGGYIAAGQSNSNDGDVTGNNGNNDYWIVKLDANGNVTWQKSLGGTGSDVTRTIQQTTDGGYIAAGQSNSNDGDVTGNHGGFDYWIVKLDANGNVTWQKSLGGSNQDYARYIQQTTDGGYIVAGRSESNDGDVTGNNGLGDYWIVKLDSSGNITWQKSLGGSTWEEAKSIQQTTDGGYIVAGYSNSNDGDVTGNHGGSDYWIVKLDNTGNITWQKSLGGTGSDVTRTIQQTTDGGYIVAGYSNSNDGDVTGNNGNNDYWIVKLDNTGNITWQKSLGGSGSDEALSIQQRTDGGYIVAGYSTSNDGDVTGNHGNRDCWIVKFIVPNIKGNVFNDLSVNCNQDNLEPDIEGIHLTITPGNFIVTTDNEGLWYLDSLPVGSHTVTLDTTNLNWSPTCPVNQTFTVTDPSVFTPGPDFGLINDNPCTSPNVSVYAPFLRRCFSNQVVYVQACNEITATGILNSSYTEVELDPYLIITSSSLPFTSLGNNVYSFDLGDLYPGQCVNFTINTTVSCDAQLGQTLCIDATLYPIESCALDTIPTPPVPPTYGNNPNLVMPQECTLPWDNSSLQVDGWCEGDSVHFSITNTGDFGGGDMDCYSPVFLYVNDTLVLIDSVQIQGQETVYFSYPAFGQTFILNAEQHPLHPGNSHPNAHVELCGSDSTQWIPDMVNNQPLDDADPVVDIYCGVVTGSYDPNDKTGYPLGVTDQNFIHPNRQHQYVVRFQNTGTDTAFTVVIRDTLDTDLNIFTVTPGVSSHNYSFRMYGPRVLEWTFNNILLPDSTTNEPESNGFVTFTVDQVPNLPEGALITNEADIYFDFNAPIITNQTEHRISYFTESSPLLNCTLGPDIVPLSAVTECSSYDLTPIQGSLLTGQENYYTLQGGPDVQGQSVVTGPITTSGTVYAYDEKLGCVSEQVLNVTINTFQTGTDIQNECDSYTWIDGLIYNASTSTPTYTYVNGAANGCDSIVTLDLTINSSSSSSQTDTGLDSYTWSVNNETYTESGTYTAVIPNAAGCDSTITLDLTLQFTGLDENESSYVAVYPNPTFNSFILSTKDLTIMNYTLVDLQGKVVLKGKIESPEQTVDISKLSKGQYNLVFEDDNISPISIIKN